MASDEDQPTIEEHLHYFNSDKNLLILQILLEGFERRQSVFTLDEFVKGSYWKIGEIQSEILDTNDFGSIEDFVIQQVLQVVEELNIGKTISMHVTGLYNLSEVIARAAVTSKDADENNIGFFAAAITELSDLRKMQEAQFIQARETGQKYNPGDFDRVELPDSSFGKYIDTIAQLAPSHIEMEIGSGDAHTKEKATVREVIKEYLHDFSKDKYLDEKPTYLEKRLYFSKQIENFHNYIKNFPIIDHAINIPFSSLRENGFEIVKMLSYLEENHRAKVRNWNDAELWNVRFEVTPITLASLLGQEDASGHKTVSGEIKLNLSFAHQTGTMLLGDQDGGQHKITVQGQVQKEVLRVIFGNSERTYSEWSLYDISEILGGEDVDETAVKNAIYQFNRKVKLTLPQIGNLFELTKHSARLNPKYINRA